MDFKEQVTMPRSPRHTLINSRALSIDDTRQESSVMRAAELIKALIYASHKAAKLAQRVRSEDELFSLLVEEKTGTEKNLRFAQDFKTLTDVLVQETIRHDLGCKFPGIGESIHGEESNVFTNALGESLSVKVMSTEEETAQLLEKVLAGNERAAKLMAEVVHREESIDCGQELLTLGDLQISTDSVGIWIDPIDSTAQYIHGKEGKLNDCGIYTQGLQCVLVLIGIYDLATGQSIGGVMNQPFSHQDPNTKAWNDQCTWGLSYNGVQANNLTEEKDNSSGVIVMSSSESSLTREKLENDFKLSYAAGAGYKLLCVVDSHVSSYVVSQGSTYKWDTCGPHGILASHGGGILNYQNALDEFKRNKDKTDDELKQLIMECEIVYHIPDSETLPEGCRWLNTGGLIAYRDPNTVVQILKKLA